MRTDYLPYINKEFYQDEDAYHFNSDTVLLGIELNFKKDLSILDIGTNTGALLIYASIFAPRLMVGIDVDERALMIAKLNLALHNLKAELYCRDLKDFMYEPFDVIITNPPFLEMDKSRRRYNQAMDQSFLSLEELFRGFKRLLKDNGSIYMIYASEYLEDIIVKAHGHGFKIMSIKPVYDTKKKVAHRVILQLKKGRHQKTRLLSPTFIHDGNISER